MMGMSATALTKPNLENSQTGGQKEHGSEGQSDHVNAANQISSGEHACYLTDIDVIIFVFVFLICM